MGGRFVPTLTELEGAFRGARRGRQTGLDGLPDDLLAALPCEMARIWHPLMVKMGLRVQEPLAFKGGRYAEIFKGKGDRRSCVASRSVFLASGVGKQFHRLLRGRLLPYLEEYSPEVTCALRGRGVDTGSHLIRLAMEWAAGEGRSSAVIFFDLTAAYYMVLRELAIGACSDEAVARLLARLGLPVEAAAELEGYLGERAALADAGVPDHLIAAASEALSSTWGVSQGCSLVAQSRRGSRPGDPLADAIFAFVFGRCRKRSRARMRAEGLLTCVPWSGHRQLERGAGPLGNRDVELGEVAYADDVALPVIAPAEDILAKTAAVASITLQGFGGHGWTPNLGEGKTEAIVRFSGPGSADGSRRLAFECRHLLRLRGGAVDGQDLRIVHSYRHLGTILTGNGSLKAEMEARRRSAVRERRSLDPFFRGAGASATSRLRIVRQVGISILTSNAGTWPELTPALLRILQSELEAWIRAALGRKRGPTEHIAFERIQAEYGMEDASDVVRGLRLRYFRRLALHGPDLLWALLQQCPPVRHGRGRQGNWTGALKADLCWLKGRSRKLGACRVRRPSPSPPGSP